MIPGTLEKTPDDTNQVRSRLFSLDILRGLAALLVLFEHLPIKAIPPYQGPEFILEGLRRIGWCGVDLFFVLSGFLISGLLFAEFKRDGALRPGRFWLRRGFKIWPCYFIAYGAMTGLNLLHAHWIGDAAKWNLHLRTLLPNILFVQNYCSIPVRWDNSWSIAVEEHFYFLLPLVLLGLASRGRRMGADEPARWFRPLLPMTFLLVGAVFAARTILAARGASAFDLYYPTHLRVDSLFVGVFLGYLHHFHRDRLQTLAKFWPYLLAMVPLALVLPLCFPLKLSPLCSTVGFSMLAVSFGATVLAAGLHPHFGRQGRLAPITKFLAWIGVYSYTIYVAHSVVYDIPGMTYLRLCLKTLVGGPETMPAIWLDRLLFLGLSIAGAVALSHLVERPFLRLRDRWIPSSSKVPTPANPSLVVIDTTESDVAMRRAA